MGELEEKHFESMRENWLAFSEKALLQSKPNKDPPLHRFAYSKVFAWYTICRILTDCFNASVKSKTLSVMFKATSLNTHPVANLTFPFLLTRSCRIWNKTWTILTNKPALPHHAAILWTSPPLTWNNIFDEDGEFCCIELDTKVIFVRAFHNESLT